MNTHSTLSKLKFWLLVELAGLPYKDQADLYRELHIDRRFNYNKGVVPDGRDRRKSSIH
jgi:hypothetical protein